MNYTFAAIVESEDVDETYLPRIVDKQGSVAWRSTETQPKSFNAGGMTVYSGKVDPKARLLRVEDVRIDVHVTNERLVSVCRKYDKGGGWVGGAGAMIVFNAVSKARAALRSHGKFLVGQTNLAWITGVGYTEKTGWLSANQLRLLLLDQSGQRLIVDFTLPKNADARAIADHLLAQASAGRGADKPGLPSYDAQAKTFAVAALPGALSAAAV